MLKFAILVVLVLGANVQADQLSDSLGDKLNTVDCLLGKPSCKSPPPPPTPSPPPSPPPSSPPPSPPPASPSPPPPSSPPPPPAGTATIFITINGDDGPLTPAQKDELAAILSARLRVNVVVVSNSGRKLLVADSVVFQATGISDCAATENLLLSYVNGGGFQADAAQQNVNFSSAQVDLYYCEGAGTATYVKPNPPPPAPGPPASSPPSPSPPTASPPAPGPIAPVPSTVTGTASSVASFTNLGAPLDDNQRQEVADVIASNLGPDVTGTATPPAGGRRHLLASDESINLLFSGDITCATALSATQAYISSPEFEDDVSEGQYPSYLTNGYLESFACTDSTGAEPTVFVAPPAPSPPPPVIAQPPTSDAPAPSPVD